MPNTPVLVVGARLAPEDVPALRDRLRDLLEDRPGDLVLCDVGALAKVDVGTVDALCRLTLTAGRLGRRLQLRNAPPELLDLLGLTGVGDVVRCSDASVEPER